jgi:hypothetical protein
MCNRFLVFACFHWRKVLLCISLMIHLDVICVYMSILSPNILFLVVTLSLVYIQIFIFLVILQFMDVVRQ